MWTPFIALFGTVCMKWEAIRRLTRLMRAESTWFCRLSAALLLLSLQSPLSSRVTAVPVAKGRLTRCRNSGSPKDFHLLAVCCLICAAHVTYPFNDTTADLHTMEAVTNCPLEKSDQNPPSICLLAACSSGGSAAEAVPPVSPSNPTVCPKKFRCPPTASTAGQVLPPPLPVLIAPASSCANSAGGIWGPPSVLRSWAEREWASGQVCVTPVAITEDARGGFALGGGQGRRSGRVPCRFTSCRTAITVGLAFFPECFTCFPVEKLPIYAAVHFLMKQQFQEICLSIDPPQSETAGGSSLSSHSDKCTKKPIQLSAQMLQPLILRLPVQIRHRRHPPRYCHSQSSNQGM